MSYVCDKLTFSIPQQDLLSYVKLSEELLHVYHLPNSMSLALLCMASATYKAYA